MKGEWLFRGTVLISLAAHGFFLAFNSGDGRSVIERMIKIPVIFEVEPPPPPPPPPEPEPEEIQKKKLRPAKLAKKIRKVVEGEGLRTGEMVDAEIGDYEETAVPEPPPVPPKSEPIRDYKPEVNRIELARNYLGLLRLRMMSEKKYPLAAQRMGITGIVTISFVVESNSSFSKVVIRNSSGHEILDKAALETVVGLSGKLQRPRELGSVDLKTSVVLKYEFNS
ncbi:MAG: energy transducer TonB [Deltaproteobacteria bacterium]|nr:energy transducer TonB [Deltaproteobacteria bacterium]